MTEIDGSDPKPKLDGRGGDFPKFTLEEAIAVPQALLLNGGQPLTAIDMGTALGRSPGSSALRQITSASSAHGLTGGSYKSEFNMQEGGRRIVEPMAPGEAAQALVAAALTPPLFRRVYDYYKGKKFPEPHFLTNTVVREFGVPQKFAARFAEVFEANMRFVGLIKDTPGGAWLAKEATVDTTGETVTEKEIKAIETDIARGEEKPPSNPPPAAPAAVARPEEKPSSGPSVHLDIQIHIPAEASPEQIDKIFASMAKHLYSK